MQMDGESGAREATARGEDLLDIAESAPDDGRQEIDIDRTGPGPRLSGRHGRA